VTDQVERRAGLTEVTAKLSQLDTDVKELKGKFRVIWGFAGMVLLQGGAFVFGYGKLVQQLEDFNLGTVQSDVSAIVNVASQHGDEMNSLRASIAQLRGEMLSIREDISVRTDDRYRRADWDANKLWLEERFNNISQRVGHLESEHHTGRNRIEHQ